MIKFNLGSLSNIKKIDSYIDKWNEKHIYKPIILISPELMLEMSSKEIDGFEYSDIVDGYTYHDYLVFQTMALEYDVVEIR